VNSVHLIGRLATDVDVKEVNGGSKVSTFILAVDRSAEEADCAFRPDALGPACEYSMRGLGPHRPALV
jgi:single-stranded DNA-binding protein